MFQIVPHDGMVDLWTSADVVNSTYHPSFSLESINIRPISFDMVNSSNNFELSSLPSDITTLIIDASSPKPTGKSFHLNLAGQPGPTNTSHQTATAADGYEAKTTSRPTKPTFLETDFRDIFQSLKASPLSTKVCCFIVILLLVFTNSWTLYQWKKEKEKNKQHDNSVKTRFKFAFNIPAVRIFIGKHL